MVEVCRKTDDFNASSSMDFFRQVVVTKWSSKQLAVWLRDKWHHNLTLPHILVQAALYICGPYIIWSMFLQLSVEPSPPDIKTGNTSYFSEGWLGTVSDVTSVPIALCTMLSEEGGVPAEALDFVPGEFWLQLPMCQGNNPETLPGVSLQSLCEALWDWRERQSHVSLAFVRPGQHVDEK